MILLGSVNTFVVVQQIFHYVVCLSKSEQNKMTKREGKFLIFIYTIYTIIYCTLGSDVKRQKDVKSASFCCFDVVSTSIHTRRVLVGIADEPTDSNRIF